MRRLDKRGFTIIELLIATVIFSVILLIVTGAIIQFSKIYYKGTITAKTQEVARTIAEDMARSAQFSHGAVDKGTRCYRFGSQKYVHAPLNTVKTQSNSVFQVGSGSTCSGAPTDPIELMGENMQLRHINVDDTTTPGATTITVTVAYGESTDMNGSGASTSCKAILLGGQFCAVSTVTTTVTQRIGE